MCPPEVLCQAGYVTFATGKWHNGEPSFVRAFPRCNLASFLAAWRTTRRSRSLNLRHGQALSTVRIAENFFSEQFADAAVDFLRSRSGGAARFPPTWRSPRRTTRETLQSRSGRCTTGIGPRSLRVSALSSPFDNGILKDIRDENLAPNPRTREVIGDQACEYYGLITHRQVGGSSCRWRSRCVDNTIIIYRSPTMGCAAVATGYLASRASTSTRGPPRHHRRPRHPRRAAPPPRSRTPPTSSRRSAHLPGSSRWTGWPAETSGRSGRARGAEDPRAPRSLPFNDLCVPALLMCAMEAHQVHPAEYHRQLFDLRDDPSEKREPAAEPGYEPEIVCVTALMRIPGSEARRRAAARREEAEAEGGGLR